MFTLGIVALVGVIFLLSIMLRVLKEYERGVIFRLGRCIGQKGPGLIILWPVIDQMTRVSTRTIAMDVPPQDVITRDNVSIKVNAVVYFRVINAVKSIIEVENYLYATSQLAQTTLRTILGKHELDDLLSEQEGIAKDLQIKIDRDTDPWGIKVSLVEIKHVDLPGELQRAMAKQAEAEREKRAKIINADGEFLAAEKLSEAAAIIEKHKVAIQLRYLQTLKEVAAENNSTTIFPIPIDLFKPFIDLIENKKKE